MGDVGDTFRAWHDNAKALRHSYGIECPECKRLQPKRDPTVMLPGQRCKVDGYRDPRPRLTNEQIIAGGGTFVEKEGPWVRLRRCVLR